MTITTEALEYHRAFWANIAKKRGWYKEPFYVEVWVNRDGEVTDSVSWQGIARDFIVEDEPDCD